MVKRVYIKYNDGQFDFTADRSNAPSGSGNSVGIRLHDKVKWIARKQDIDVEFDGFTIQFKSPGPLNGLTYDSEAPTPQNVHSKESDEAPDYGIAEYSVTLHPGSQSIDPEVRVEEPGVDQCFCSAVVEKSNTERELDCENVTVYEWDLLRVELDVDSIGRSVPDFEVSFPSPCPFWEGTMKSNGPRYSEDGCATFYYQIQPVQQEENFTYEVSIPSLELSGEGQITVLPLPDLGKLNG